MYKCKLHIGKVTITAGLLECVKAIYINNKCIVAKNNKFGNFYFSPYVKNITGKFEKVACSNSSPRLLAKTKEVILDLEGFNEIPKLNSHFHSSLIGFDEKYLSHIYITDIQKIN
jgi:hypothetical protein